MSVSITDNCCIIENNCLAKQLNISKGRIKNTGIYNKLSGESITGAQGSEEFIICFRGGLFGERVAASSLKIQQCFGDDSGICETLTVKFAPFKVKGQKITLSLIYELGAFDSFLRKHFEFESTDKTELSAVLDYIDFENILLHDGLSFHSLPEQSRCQISGFALSLGQPVFVGSMFCGCEFPAALNKIENGAVSLRCYSGKPLCKISGKDGVYISHKAVFGACTGNSESKLRAEFFDYIEKTSRKSRLSVQYNSWYDHMLNISGENIEHSFFEIEKGITESGTPPMDRFVVDDGWNDYSKNFWSFNSKFPNEAYRLTQLCSSLGSGFGLWLGPRGGYTSDTPKFAKHIEQGGNGYYNWRSGDIDTASEKYINKVSDLLYDYQSRFGISYWKFDGFCKSPCRNKNHDHIVGGKNDIYYYSEYWERWTKVFDRLITQNSDVFINLTSYAPPSPWFLQWTDTVWLQISSDMGMLKKGPNGKSLGASQKDMLLSYRDEIYYDFSRFRQFCFPLGRLYNHDPIYGNEAKISMTDDEFREYLFMIAARGSELWELYYSFNMMNKAKWRINDSVLLFVRENFELLKHSVMFGGRPSLCQVYGYGCFGYDEGIVALRNSGPSEQTYVLRLDESIGAKIGLSNARLTTVIPYGESNFDERSSYGDTLKIDLAAYEVKILHFGKKFKPLSAEYVKARNSNTLEVTFNQTVLLKDLQCRENDIVNVKLLEDYRTALIEFEKPFEKENRLTLCKAKNMLSQSADIEVSFEFFESYIITSGCIKGNTDFSIVATTGGDESGELFVQENEISLLLENGKCHFRVGESEVVSTLPDGGLVQVCAVRERNGVLKLYLNKKLHSGLFPKEKAELSGGKSVCFDENRIRLYSRALAYDEV